MWEKCKKDNKKPAGFFVYRRTICKEYNLGSQKRISVVFVQLYMDLAKLT
jgi:hypothetical protein